MEMKKATSNFQIGEVEFKPSKQELIFSRFRSVKLTNKESGILQYLLEHANKAITLTELMKNCLGQYPDDPIGTRKIIQCLSTKLEFADHIEYPYIDCYRFRCDKEPQQTSLLSLNSIKNRIKRFFNRADEDHAVFSCH